MISIVPRSHIRNILFCATRASSTTAKTQINKRIEGLINGSNKRVFVFMKGVPSQPECGYSAAVVKILNIHDVDFGYFNVLEDEQIRTQIKTYSNWPTIPQVYVDGNFVGGCDIILQMERGGELDELLAKKK